MPVAAMVEARAVRGSSADVALVRTSKKEQQNGPLRCCRGQYGYVCRRSLYHYSIPGSEAASKAWCAPRELCQLLGIHYLRGLT